MSSPCIFCTSPAFSGVGVEPAVKSEVIITPVHRYTPQLPAYQDVGPTNQLFEGDSAIQGNLGSFFILKRIFKLSDETLSLFLTLYNDIGHPEDWISTCASCRKSVTQFFRILKKISSLERQLIKLETELTGKIEGTKDFQGDGNPVWKQIRKKVLSNCISQGQAKVDVSNINTGVLTDSEPTLDFPVHLEDVNEEQDNNSRPPPPTTVAEPPSSSSFLDPLHQDSAIKGLNSTKIRKLLQHPIKTKYLSNRRSIRMGGKSYRGCLQCPYYTENSKFFEAHLKLHEEGAPHTICEGCGHYVRFGGMLRHLRNCSGTPKTSNPHYKAFRKGDNLLHYSCRHCPYKTPKISLVLKHATLHEEGAEAKVCGECGRYLPSKQLKLHQTVFHRTKEISILPD